HGLYAERMSQRRSRNVPCGPTKTDRLFRSAVGRPSTDTSGGDGRTSVADVDHAEVMAATCRPTSSWSLPGFSLARLSSFRSFSHRELSWRRACRLRRVAVRLSHPCDLA